MAPTTALAIAAWLASTGAGFRFSFRARPPGDGDGADGSASMDTAGILAACGCFCLATLSAAYAFGADVAAASWAIPPMSAAAAAFVLLAALWAAARQGIARILGAGLLVTCSALMTALCVANLVTGPGHLVANLSVAPLFHASLTCAIGTVAGLWAALEGQERWLRVGGKLVTPVVFVATQYWTIADALLPDGQYTLPFAAPGTFNPATLAGYLVTATAAAVFLAFDSERRRKATLATKEDLRNQLDLTSAMLERSTEGILFFDEAMRVRLWNPTMEGFTGTGAADAVGKPLREAVPDHMAVRLVEACRRVLVGGSELVEGKGPHPVTGDSVMWRMACSPALSRDGRLVGGVVIMSDVTRWHALEETFRQAQKMEAVGQLTGGMAHDFNNLLHVVQSSLPLLEGGDAAAGEVVRKAIGRGRAITRQLLAFAGRHESEAAPIDAGAHARGMLDLLETTLGNSAEFMPRISRDAARVRVDPTDLDLAVLNLCLNARDAVGRDGRVSLVVENERLAGRAAAGLPEGDYVAVSVKDNGSGMDGETQARACEPFFTRKRDGTGLGLAQVAAFARRWGGAVRIHSFSDVGTTVTILLPRLPPTETEVGAAPAGTAAAPVPGPARGSRGNILIVDDDAMVVDATRLLMDGNGWLTAVVSSGEEALEVLAEYDVDVVLSDVRMPGGMDGYELAERIGGGWPEVRVVLATGQVKTPLSRLGNVALLAKPFTLDDFEEALAATGAGTAPAHAVEDARAAAAG